MKTVLIYDRQAYDFERLFTNWHSKEFFGHYAQFVLSITESELYEQAQKNGIIILKVK